MRKSRPTRVLLQYQGMEELLAAREYQAAWNLIVKEIEDDPEDREELRELFTLVLSIHW